jgi:hypothetical protein
LRACRDAAAAIAAVVPGETSVLGCRSVRDPRGYCGMIYISTEKRKGPIND